LLTMVDDSTRRVRAFVDESEISTICLRQGARLTADAVPGIQMEATVENIGAAIVENCQRFVPAIPSGDAVYISRSATDADWSASVSSILAVRRWAERFRQVTCAQKADGLDFGLIGGGLRNTAVTVTRVASSPAYTRGLRKAALSGIVLNQGAVAKGGRRRSFAVS
jgi:hypothetical protein